MRVSTANLAAVFIAATAVLAFGQGEPDRSGLSAREIFYSSPKVAAERPGQPAAISQSPASTVESAPEAPATTSTPSVSTPEPVPEIAVSTPRVEAPIRSDTEAPMGGVPQVILAAHSDLPPLGIRCSILRRQGGTSQVEVDPDGVFESGDRIRLRVQANDDGYLYVVHQGSSGVWKPLFPSPEIENGSNWIAGGASYDIPQGYVFTFDEQPGEEKLFVVLSREPVQDLENLIYDLGDQQPSAPRQDIMGSPKILLAQNLIDIDDNVVNGLRNAYARDLIIEKVTGAATSGVSGSETAVYAVSATDSAGSRVVVDFNLQHQ